MRLGKRLLIQDIQTDIYRGTGLHPKKIKNMKLRRTFYEPELFSNIKINLGTSFAKLKKCLIQ